MEDDFEAFIQALEGQIHEEMKQAYGEKAFHLWLRAPNAGTLPDPDAYACVRGPCGDAMEVFLNFEDERVSQATYRTDGCGATVACGSMAVEMALGRGPDDLVEITGEAILEALGSLPLEERHCAYLAAETLQSALNDYMVKKQRPKKGGEREAGRMA